MDISFINSLEFIKKLFRNFFIYLLIGVSCLASFWLGFYYNKLTLINHPQKINKKEITLAIDEYNNIIVFDKKTGIYTIYEDSVGNAIFNLYTKNLWNEHK